LFDTGETDYEESDLDHKLYLRSFDGGCAGNAVYALLGLQRL
jgi:hypothetical protein